AAIMESRLPPLLRQFQPAVHDGARLVDALLGFAGEHLHADGVAVAGRQVLAHRQQGVALRAAAELVGLGQQRVRRQPAAHGVTDHLPVVVLERMADVHHHDQAAQGLAGGEPAVQELLPVRLQVLRHLGVAVAGQVDEVAVLVRRDREIDQLLGPPRRLRHPGQGVLPAQGVERGRLAGVGTTGERHFPAAVGRQLAVVVGGEQVGRAFEGVGHGRHGHSFSRRRFDRLRAPTDNSGTYLESCMRNVRAYGIAALTSLLVAAAAYAQTADQATDQATDTATVTPLPEAAPVEAAPLDASATEALAQAHWGDAKAGATKAGVCAACHGVDGNPSDPMYPRIAGMPERYVAEQLALYKSGQRNTGMAALMVPMASMLSAQDMRDVGAYFAQQKPAAGIADDTLIAEGPNAGLKFYQVGERLF